MSDDILAELRADIEQRVRNQFERHLRINPNADPSHIVEIQIEQEREKLERMYQKFQTDEPEKFAEFTRVLIDDWLPMLSKELKTR